jgi:hypothetical protein
MTLTLQPVRVGNGADEEGLLVFFNSRQRLVAVLTHLGGQYDSLSGHWYLEAGFGRVDGINHPTFADLEAAKDWISRRLAQQS